MNNLPTVAVHDVIIHPLYKDLIIGTHGRGIWICDDISALQQMTESVAASPTHLFDSRPATQWMSFSRGGSRGQFFFSGENPPQGALVHYNLGANVQDATLEITDMSGEMKLTVKHLRDELAHWDDDAEVYFEGLDFYRSTKRGGMILQIELNQIIHDAEDS